MKKTFLCNTLNELLRVATREDFFNKGDKACVIFEVWVARIMLVMVPIASALFLAYGLISGVVASFVFSGVFAVVYIGIRYALLDFTTNLLTEIANVKKELGLPLVNEIEKGEVCR